MRLTLRNTIRQTGDRQHVEVSDVVYLDALTALGTGAEHNVAGGIVDRLPRKLNSSVGLSCAHYK